MREQTATFMIGLALTISPAMAKDSKESAVSNEPLNANVDIQPLRYETPFVNYRSYQENPVASWREANDVVGRIGGWKVYAREAYEATNQPTSTTSGKSAPVGAPKNPGEAKAK